MNHQETVYAEGIPCLIVPSLSEVVTPRGRYFAHYANERGLVHRLILTYCDRRYVVDYLTTRLDGVWQEYTVVYEEGNVSPFPHTMDLRNEPIQDAPSVAASSSGFRAAAMAAIMEARRAAASL